MCVRRLGVSDTRMGVSIAGVGVDGGGEPAVVRTALRTVGPSEVGAVTRAALSKAVSTDRLASASA